MKFFRVLILGAIALPCALSQSPTPDFSTGQAARLVVGQPNFTIANYGATNTLLGSPSGVAVANGILWVVDANRVGSTPNNNRVLRFSDITSYPSPTQDPTMPGATCGVCRGQATLVLGQPDFVSSSFSLTPTGMRSPTGVATDGNILAVSDTDNNRVLIWLSLPRGNGQPADVVIGQPDFVHNATSVPPTAKSLRGPQGLWIAGGKLFVADTQDNRVLIYNRIPTSNNAAADVVVGQPDFTSFVQPDLTQATNATPTASNMQDPVSVTTDGQRMYITDLGQNRVLIWNSIPATNGAPADVVLGQPDMVNAVPNYSFRSSGKLDSNNNPSDATQVLCASTGTDSAGSALFPARCAATLSFPRMALSDGKRLFVADGGNDRVLVYKSIPATNGQPADYVLGQPDEFTDNTGQNPDGTDAFQTPTALAWDAANGNLYVSDTYNRRVVIYSPGVPKIPLAGARNAASLDIFAIGSVVISGTVTAKDTVTITINSRKYTYTITSNDTLTTITDNLVKQINQAPDPDVVASPNDTTNTVVLTARVGGSGGSSITLAVATSTNATIVTTPSGANLSIYLQSPTSIAPGTIVELAGTNLCDNAAAGDFTQPYLATSLAGCQLFIDGIASPLLYVSPAQINAQMPWFVTDRTSVSIYARATHADGSVTVTSPIAATIVPENPGIFAGGGNDPRPGFVFHGSSAATDLISVDGAIHAGDVATITIGSAPYTYTVQSSDTLATIRDALISAINSAPDPNVYARASNEYTRIILSALTPGPAGESVSITAAVTGTSASLSLTVFNPTMCCDNQQGALVTTSNPAIPGEIVYVLATGLGPAKPVTVDTGQVFRGSTTDPPVPPATPVDSILTGGKTANVVNVSLAPGMVGVYFVEFQLSTSVTTDPATQMTIAQQTFVSNVVTFPVLVPGESFSTSAAASTASRSRPR